MTREFSSGGVVFKENEGEVLWLVRSTAPSALYPTQYMMFPKGWLDDAGPGIPGPMASGKIKANEESLREAAMREVLEEGGIEPVVIKKIGTQKYSYEHPVRGPILKFVTFYLMKWIKDLPEGHDGETSEVFWLPFEEAKKQLSFGGEKQMLVKAKKLLASVAHFEL